MKNGQHQILKMQQKLSPQQLMLMQLLQLPVTALEQRLKEEVEKNPMLDVSTGENSMMEVLPDTTIQTDGDDMLDDAVADDDYNYRERLERDSVQPFEAAYVSETTFGDLLNEQLSMKSLTDRQRIIAQEIVGTLDDAGYVGRDINLLANDLAFTQGIEVSPDEVMQVLRVVQSLEPAGIAARSLQECLSIQLHRDENQSDVTVCATKVVDQCFDLFVKSHFDRIMEQLHLSEEQLQGAVERIRSLNPKPGGGDGESVQSRYIIPDFVVSRQGDELFLHVNDGHLPRITTNAYYQEMLHQLSAQPRLTPSEQETFDFIHAKTEDANVLVDTMRQRHATMTKVMRAILRRQYHFFLSGNQADLRPLLQKDIAQDTGYDISTVSRVVNSKYVQTDFGTFLLKDCFSQAIVNNEGDEVSIETVRQLILSAVATEDRQNPLTDDDLARLLTEKGFPVARRTVAKYRQMLDIPVARLRRHLKMLILFLVSLAATTLYAQQPQKESYFDSLVNARIREGQTKARAASNTNPKTGKPHAAKPALEIHEPVPEPNAIDTALAAGDELIDVMYNSTLPPPSALWYGHNLSGAHVRLGNFTIDSLPDEISIQLLKGNEKFCFPVKNIITSPYGWRWNRPHRGVDVRLKMGEPVHCAFNGVVRIARPMGGYGNLVVVRHYNGLETVYGHLSKINVKPMQVVAAGQVLGLGGSTGHSTGPHLHFEVRFQYEPFDPEWILDFSNYSLRTRRLYLDKTYFGIRRPTSSSDHVYKADKSIVPEEPAPKAQPSKPVYATLRKNETLADFAKRNYTTVDKINQLNPDLKKPKAGVRIRVR